MIIGFSLFSCQEEEDEIELNQVNEVFENDFIYKAYNPVVSMVSFDSARVKNNCFFLFPNQAQRDLSLDLSNGDFDIHFTISHQSLNPFPCTNGYSFRVEVSGIGSNSIQGSSSQIDIYEKNDSLVGNNWVKSGVIYSGVGMPSYRGSRYISTKSTVNGIEYFGYVKIEITNDRLYIQSSAINQLNSNRITAGQMAIN